MVSTYFSAASAPVSAAGWPSSGDVSQIVQGSKDGNMGWDDGVLSCEYP